MRRAKGAKLRVALVGEAAALRDLLDTSDIGGVNRETGEMDWSMIGETLSSVFYCCALPLDASFWKQSVDLHTTEEFNLVLICFSSSSHKCSAHQPLFQKIFQWAAEKSFQDNRGLYENTGLLLVSGTDNEDDSFVTALAQRAPHLQALRKYGRIRLWNRSDSEQVREGGEGDRAHALLLERLSEVAEQLFESKRPSKSESLVFASTDSGGSSNIAKILLAIVVFLAAAAAMKFVPMDSMQTDVSCTDVTLSLQEKARELNDLRAEQEARERELEKCQGEVGKCHDELKTYQSSQKKKDTEHQQFQDMYHQTDKQLAALNAAHQKTLQDLESVNRQHQDKTRELQQVHAELSREKANVSHLQNSIKKLEDELKGRPTTQQLKQLEGLYNACKNKKK